MTDPSDFSRRLEQRAARGKKTIDDFWAGAVGLRVAGVVAVAAVIGVLVGFGVL